MHPPLRHVRAGLLAAAAVLAFSLAACGESAGEAAAEAALVAAGAGDVEINDDGGTVSYRTEQGQVTITGGDAAVLDARSAGRFTGEEPDPREGVRAGHMPGAGSLHYAALAPDGRMLPPDALAARLQQAAGERPIIASCGSGVTAAVVALAATLAGRSASVYDGSWSEWGRADSGRPVVQGG